jgi:hypothetical protein
MLNAFFSRTGVIGLPDGDPLLNILEIVAQSGVRNEQAIFQMLTSISLDNASGTALDAIAMNEGVVVQQNLAATGSGRLVDTSFTKISSNIYAGTAPVLIGANTINIVDGSTFPTSGKLYLGRGTVNYEGPLAYSGIINNGQFWTITLTGTTARFHNVLETVVFAQGGTRTASAGLVVSTAIGGPIQSTTYATLDAVTIPDGETFSNTVSISCNTPGTVGNAVANTISVVPSAPFTGAGFVNDLPITNGANAWNDDQIKDAIRKARQSRSQGTETAILNSVQGLASQTDNKRVLSASYVEKNNEPDVLYIDDGTGYEETVAGVGQETEVNSAVGGEQYFQLGSPRPIAKACVTSTSISPFGLSNGQQLTVAVGGYTYTHTFDISQFNDITNATAFEVASSINSDSTIPFSARVSDSTKRVTLFAKSETDDDLQVLTNSNDANVALQFTTVLQYTVKLYQNGILLYKDGRNARLQTAPQSAWNGLIGSTGSETLVVQVDGRQAVTYTFTAADFVNAGTGYNSIAAFNSLTAWAAVFNYKVVGVTATVEVDHLVLTSNLGAVTGAQVAVLESGSSLVTNGMFSAVNSTVSGTAPTRTFFSAGLNSDFTLNRNTGGIRLTVPLAAGDVLTAGSTSTRATVTSAALAPGLALAANGNVWVTVDGTSQNIATNITTATSITTSVDSDQILFQFVGVNWITNVQSGDWVILWDPNLVAQGIPAGAYRVSWVSHLTNEYFHIEQVIGGFTGGAITLSDVTGLVFVRTTNAPQKIALTSGTTSLTSIVGSINTQAVGFTAGILQSKYITLTSDTYNTDGSMMIAGADTGGKALLFPERIVLGSQPAHVGFVQTTDREIGTPDLFSNQMTNRPSANTTNYFIDNPFVWAGGEISWQGALNASPLKYVGANKGHFFKIQSVSQSAYSGTAISYNHTTKLTTVTMPSTGGLTTDNWLYIKFYRHTIMRDGFYHVSTVPGGTSITIDMDLGGADFSDTVAADIYLTLATTRTDVNYNNNIANESYNTLRPLSNGPTDKLSAIIDQNDITQNYSLPMYRRIQPITSQQYVQNAVGFKDLDYSGLPLTNAWTVNGQAFDFSDFAVFGKSKVISDNGNSAISVKWINTRFGPEGDDLRVRYTYGTAPQQNVSVTTTTDEYSYYNVNLATSTSKGSYGMSVSSAPSATKVSSGGNYATTVIFGFDIPVGGITASAFSPFVINAASQLPAGGFSSIVNIINPAVPSYVYLTGPDATLPTGLYQVASVTSTTITLTFMNNTAGSYGSSGTYNVALCDSTAGSSIVVNFLGGTALAIGNIATTKIFNSISSTSSITTVSKWWFTTKTVNPVNDLTPRNEGVSLGDLANITFYTITSTPNTVSNIVSSVNASVSPALTAVVKGSGSGTVLVSSEDQFIAGTIKAPYYEMQGGVNYVKSSNVAASTLSFKIDPAIQQSGIAGSNSYQYDQEEFRLVPMSAINVAAYLNAPAVSGLFSNAAIQTSENGKQIEINSFTVGGSGSVQITGGSANSAAAPVFGTGIASGWNGKITTKTAFLDGFVGKAWCKIQNSVPQIKRSFLSTDVITTSGNTFTVTSGAVLGTVTANMGTLATWRVFKEGGLVHYAFQKNAGTAFPFFGSTDGGSFVIIRSSFNSANQGLFRVVKFYANGFWIENPNAVEEGVNASQLTANYMQFLSATSIVPGDQIYSNGDVLGPTNNKTFAVVDVPQSVGTYASLTVDQMFGPSSVTLGNGYVNLFIKPKYGDVFYKQIKNIIANDVTPATYSDVLFYDELNFGSISAANGSVVTMLDKLQFPTPIQIGQDAYKFNTGLVQAANQVLYGDSSQPEVFPGVVAASGDVNVQGPLVKRIQVSLGVRIKSGTIADSSATLAILNRVKSAVASVINASPVGQSISISSIIENCQMVNGVDSIAVIYPTYNVGNDRIPVQPFEKALVLNLDNDVTVNIIGE